MRYDEQDFETYQEKVDAYAENIQELVDERVHYYCSDLDTLMNDLEKLLLQNDVITNQDMDKYVLRLSTLLYWVGDGLEATGLKEDISKMIKTEAYNNSYDGVSGKAHDKKVKAEEETVYETLIYIAYSRAYKTIKIKLDQGVEMLQSLKKVLSRRMSELEFSRSDREGK